MNAKGFLSIRKTLGKTQKQLAELLGVSLKAVHSYEQGWRNIPVHIERQLLFLVSRKQERSNELAPCWEILECPPERKVQCPAWEFHTGDLCWFINGTICEGIVHKKWRDKMNMCRRCEVFMAQMNVEFH